ncbi:hypothetical protein ACFOLF_11915 [Paenibacillus sepulcri]
MIAWNSKWIATAAAGMILAAALPSFAQAADLTPPLSTSSSQEQNGKNEQWSNGHDHRKYSESDREKHRMRRLTEAARYFGIETAGKDADQLREELKAARKADEAKWKRFETEQKAKHLAKLQAFAKKLGIATEGKDARQLRQEIRERCKDKHEKQEHGTSSEAPEPNKLKTAE